MWMQFSTPTGLCWKWNWVPTRKVPHCSRLKAVAETVVKFLRFASVRWNLMALKWPYLFRDFMPWGSKGWLNVLGPPLSNGKEQQIAEVDSPSLFLRWQTRIAHANRSLGSLKVQTILFIFNGWPGATQVVQVSTASEILFAWKYPST